MADINWIRSKNPCTTDLSKGLFIDVNGETYPAGDGDPANGVIMKDHTSGDFSSYAGIGSEVDVICADSSGMTPSANRQLMVEGGTGKVIDAVTPCQVVGELIEVDAETEGVDGILTIRVVSYTI